MKEKQAQEKPWSIILAGGEGERLRPMVQRWLGRYKPKQYCTFVGTRSMFQHTLDRADQITTPDRKVTVIAKAHYEDALPQLAGRQAGKLILQPRNLDTAAGIFLALAHVRAQDPNATVFILPSDHFIHPEEQFVQMVRSAVRAAEQLRHWIFLLGVAPENAEAEYGWIIPGARLGWIDGHRVHASKSFLEKPRLEKCREAMEDGALWNTLILVAKVETLWTLGWRCLPDMMPLFEVYGEVIGTSEEQDMLKAIYELLPAHNFSKDLLECVPAQVAVLELSNVHWCDWGNADRIVSTLYRIGKHPSFDLAHAAGQRTTQCIVNPSTPQSS
jgi:mannose-1-phosphate guanylyltransferase